MAEMTSESVELLDDLLVPPSDVTIPLIKLDPAFNRIRNDPEFMAMMERHRE